MSSSSPLVPPAPFPEFDFSFDPSLPNLFPPPPLLPSSADLFSQSETTDLFGFLDNFTWEFDQPPLSDPLFNDLHHAPSKGAPPPYSNPHLNIAPEPSTSSRPRPVTRSASSRANLHEHAPLDDASQFELPQLHRTRSNSSSSTAVPSPSDNTNNSAAASASAGSSRAKPLLSTPQKRLNHIMSEQKRRNAIRDGYAQLIALLAPAGAPPGLGMPTRGRPKGSGSRGKGRSKGKSGVLFRAVEYCHWLEEGIDALREEVSRLEAAAGIIH